MLTPKIITGGILVSFSVFLMLFGRMITPYDPLEIFVGNVYESPNAQFIFGTDGLGRDILSRIICGTYWSLICAFMSALICLSIGSALGAFSGYIGGPIDGVITLFMDALYTIPLFAIAIVISVVLGRGITNTALAIGIIRIPRFFRVVRSQTVSVKQRGFIEAERMIGAKPLHVLRHHVIPYVTPMMLTLITRNMSTAILLVAGLGFLGLGVPPPLPEWGTDLYGGREVLVNGVWWPSIFPGIMIFISILSFNILSEGIHEALSPSQRSMGAK